MADLWEGLCGQPPIFDGLIQPFPGKAGTDVLRLDRIDSQLSGNKLFKLLGHLLRWQESGAETLLSFGGRWSNHLHALAFASQRLNIPVVAMVQGYPAQPLTATLQDCVTAGMKLVFCNRREYARRYDAVWRAELAEAYGAWVIPEGGDGPEGEYGFSLLAETVRAYDEVWLAAGTGTTARGLAAQMTSTQSLNVINAVADQGALFRASQLWRTEARVQILDDFHEGGFGRASDDLLQLIHLYDAEGLPLDPV
ncbi:MAG: hypothetical protein VW274_07305, partial [Thalassolituus sp.]